MLKKILDLKTLQKKIKILKKKQKIIVLCHGVFDLLHIGHIKHLEKAKELGDILVVTLTPDTYVNKGPGRPLFNQNLRSESLAALSSVDFVSINNNSTAANIIRKIKPNIYCKGQDYKDYNDDITGEIKNEIRELKKVNGKVVFTNELTHSSSSLINQTSNDLSLNQKKIIKKIKKSFNLEKIQNEIDKIKKLKVLVIGETIIDRYFFCEPLGKSGKDPILVFKENKFEEYLGGSLAIARNISPFCKNVTVLSALGEHKEYLRFIKKKLNKKIKFNFIYKKNSPTIVKTKYLDSVTFNKVFGLNKINGDLLNKMEEMQFLKMLHKEIIKHDLVIVSDYGHGLITKKIASSLVQKSKYLAINAQINSANLGFHTLKNYKKSDCCIINENEIRYELRNKNDKIEKLMNEFIRTNNPHNLIVTQGNKGSKILSKKIKKIDHIEAFSKGAVDKVGAGDTMLAFISALLKNKTDRLLALFIGSLAAAISVQSFANKKDINKIALLKFISRVLK